MQAGYHVRDPGVRLGSPKPLRIVVRFKLTDNAVDDDGIQIACKQSDVFSQGWADEGRLQFLFGLDASTPKGFF